MLRRASALAYVQGQHHGRAREYFYFIDHVGQACPALISPRADAAQLFLDDVRIRNFTSCYKGSIE